MFGQALDKDSDEVKACVSAKIAILINEGKEPDQAAAIAYSMCREDASAHLKGLNGLAEREGVTASDVDADQLKIGTEHEMEHTSDPKIARQIALDHLTEDPDYYKKLPKSLSLGNALFPGWAKSMKLAPPDPLANQRNSGI